MGGFMLRRSFPVLALVLVALCTEPLLGAMRVTRIDGKEGVVARGSSVRQTKVAADARKVGANADVTITAGADTDAANNDYRRIQNAINAATAGDTITLSGTFDFTQPFAAAAWALGNDNTAATGDDYSVLVPAGLNNITLTATSQGAATILGPGDLAAIDLEGFLVFNGGDNQDWTISNLVIQDFDLSIGMFNGAGGSDAFNNTLIENNLIIMPNDLNATVAPADPLQNVGIHYSFGTNQTIRLNQIRIPGDSVSASPNFAASVGMQSNTSGGAVYDGLLIESNAVTVLNAQSAFPENILGIWENAHGHSSDITVRLNTFLNNAAGNDPALNLQRAFRVTSHSSLTTTVLYEGNAVSGANIGYQWLASANFAGNQPVLITDGSITSSNTGILVQSSGLAHLEQMDILSSGTGGGVQVLSGSLAAAGASPNGIENSFIKNGSGDGVWITATAGAIAPLFHNDLGGNTGFGLRNDAAPLIIAERNWWGSNLAASVAAEVSGNIDFDPWLASGTDTSGTVGFQPFIFATTSGALTTFVGTSGADTGALLATTPNTTMQMNGVSGFTLTTELINFDIQLQGDNDLFTLGQTGIPTILDGGTGNDTLIGTNVAQTWNITGTNSGNIPGATSSFVNVESLRGGSDADLFDFGAAGNLALNLDGGLGLDTLNNTAIPAATVTPTGPGTLDGQTGTATGIGGIFDNINLIAGPTDVSVAKSGPATAPRNSVISYTIVVTNSGPSAADSVQLDDVIPVGTTFASLVPAAGWACVTPVSGGTGTVTCTIASMPSGPASFTLFVNGPAVDSTVTNTATVTSVSDSTPGNNTSTANTIVASVADLSLTKDADRATVPSGGAITYTITVTNNGPQPATNVAVTDALPAGVVLDSATASQGSCTGTTTITCTIGTLANGASATVTLVVDVTAVNGATIVNTASATADEGDPSPANATDAATVTVATAVQAIPTASEWGLLLLAMAMALFALARMR
jgi:uncharacterized repeat protein (TIGR01451 family)